MFPHALTAAPARWSKSILFLLAVLCCQPGHAQPAPSGIREGEVLTTVLRKLLAENRMMVPAMQKESDHLKKRIEVALRVHASMLDKRLVSAHLDIEAQYDVLREAHQKLGTAFVYNETIAAEARQRSIKSRAGKEFDASLEEIIHLSRDGADQVKESIDGLTVMMNGLRRALNRSGSEVQLLSSPDFGEPAKGNFRRGVLGAIRSADARQERLVRHVQNQRREQATREALARRRLQEQQQREAEALALAKKLEVTHALREQRKLARQQTRDAAAAMAAQSPSLSSPTPTAAEQAQQEAHKRAQEQAAVERERLREAEEAETRRAERKAWRRLAEERKEAKPESDSSQTCAEEGSTSSGSENANPEFRYRFQWHSAARSEFERLDPTAQDAIEEVMAKVEGCSGFIPRKHAKYLKKSCSQLFELRPNGGQNALRPIYAQGSQPGSLILLMISNKARLEQDIDTAAARAQEGPEDCHHPSEQEER